MRARPCPSLALVGLSTLTLLLAGACGSDPPGQPASSSPDASADGSTDAPADVVQPPVGCEPLKDPKDSPKCIDDAYGVFVAPNGAAGAAGTRTSPVGSITEALTKLDTPNGRKPRIYVCAGDYSESVSLSTAVSVYGGLDCGTWAPGAAKPKFTAKAPGEYALRVSGGADLSVTDLEFIAQAAGQAATSSIAAFVSEATGKVQFTRVSLTANDAANGASAAGPGADGELMSSTPTAGTLNGNMGDAVNGGPAQACTCKGGKTSTGGKGGQANGQDGASGLAVINPPNPANSTGAAGTVAECAGMTLGGRPGSNAPNGSDAAALTSSGDLTSTGWKPGDGTKGADGTAGQGGGGGAGVGGGGGGSGGCGGCPGLGGEGGKGGGASIALLVFSSPNLSLSQVTLTSKKAGDGGAGAGGGTGIAGGFGGNPAAGGCLGGRGGMGGNGGAGAGGAGGVSAGIVFKGAKPKSEGVTYTPGTKGNPGTSPGNAGPDGQVGQELEIK